MLGNICLHRLPVPWTIALAVGAAVESNIGFLLLVSGVGNRVSFGLLGAVWLAAFWGVGRGAAGVGRSASGRGGARRGAARGYREGAGGSREHSPRSRGAGMLRGAVPDQRAGAGVGERRC